MGVDQMIEGLLNALIKLGGPKCNGVVVLLGDTDGAVKEMHKTANGSHIDGLAAGLRAALGLSKPAGPAPLVVVPHLSVVPPGEVE